MVAAVLLLLLGVGALTYAITSLVTPEPGWQEIEAGSSAGASCAEEFVFLYELGAGELSVSAENRAVTALYTQAARKAYQMFNSDEGFDDVVSVYDINRHPNEVMEVDEALYQAFSALHDHGNRAIYLGPVYARYGDLFYCVDDTQIVDFDPRLSEDVRQEYQEIAAYAVDSGAVDLQLLGGNQVRLYVSEEYRTYAEQEGIEDFIDFSWMKNAFIADYLAQTMIDGGFTHGAISSYDGFQRNLDDRDVSYTLNVYDRTDGLVYPAASMEYVGAMSIVYLRGYPLSNLDNQRYYQMKNGEIRTPYLDVQDGICKSAVNDLIAYSKSLSCAEVLLSVSPLYVAETLDYEGLSALTEKGIYSIYCQDRVVIGNDSELILTNLYDEGSIRYRAEIP